MTEKRCVWCGSVIDKKKWREKMLNNTEKLWKKKKYCDHRCGMQARTHKRRKGSGED